VYGWNGNAPLTAIFAAEGTNLVGWDLGSGFNDRSAISIMDLQRKSCSAALALFRNSTFNVKGGPNTFFEDLSNLYNDSLKYVHVEGNLELTSLTLPETWYVGPQESVYVRRDLVGFDLSLGDMLDLGYKSAGIGGVLWGLQRLGQESAKKMLETMGGWVGIAILAVDVAGWTRWDTVYFVGHGTNMPPQPVPTPPVP